MTGIKYNSLSLTEKNCFTQMCREAENYSLQFVFRNVDENTVKRAYVAMIDDNPQYFWLSGGYSMNILTRGTEKTITLTPKLWDGIRPSDIRMMDSNFKSTVNMIVSYISPRYSTYEKIIFVHDFLVKSTDYVLNAPNCYNAYGCLVGKRAVCAGYAAAFQLILNRLGITCGTVRGTKNEWRNREADHRWNYVEIGGRYYHVDVTWDDPIVEGGSSIGSVSHDYFCVTTKEICMTHKIINETPVPLCTDTQYDYYVYMGWYVNCYSFEAVRRIAEAQLRSGNSFTVKFSSASEAEKAVKDLITNSRVFSISGIRGRVSYSRSKTGAILTVENK